MRRYYCNVNTDLFYLKGRIKERQRFPRLPARFPKDHNCQAWGTLKPGVWNTIQVSQVQAGTQVLAPSFAAFLGKPQGVGLQVEQPWLTLECQCRRPWLNQLRYNPLLPQPLPLLLLLPPLAYMMQIKGSYCHVHSRASILMRGAQFFHCSYWIPTVHWYWEIIKNKT